MISYISNQPFRSAWYTIKKKFYPTSDSITFTNTRNRSFRTLQNVEPVASLKKIPQAQAESLISSIIEDDNASLNFDYLQDLHTGKPVDTSLDDLTPFLIRPSDFIPGTTHSNQVLDLIKTKTTDEEKINFTYDFYVNNFESLLLYSKPYSLGTHQDGTQIYSNFNPNFLNSLNFKELPPSINNYEPYIASSPNIFLKRCLDREAVTTFVKGNLDSEEKKIPPLYFCSRSAITQNSNHRYSSDLNLINSDSFLDEQFNQGKESFTVLHLPSWGSKSLKDPVWKTVNPSFLKRRKGVFVPTLSKAQILNKDKTLTQVYFLTLTLISNNSFDKSLRTILNDHQNPANSFFNFIEKYIFEDSIYFLDPKKYQEKLLETYSSCSSFLSLNVSNPNILAYCKRYHRIKKLGYFASFSSEDTFDSKTSFYISSRPKENSQLSIKLKKASFKFSKYLEDLVVFKSQLQEFFQLINQAKKFYSLKLGFKFNKTELIQFENIHTKFESFNAKYSKLKTNQQAFLETSLKDGNYETDSFYENLKTNSIFITSISYQDNGILTNTTLKNFVNLKLSNLKITNVVFLIDKPVAIYVDSKQNPKAIKVAGPYVVTVNSNSLSLRLKDEHSLFAFTEGQSYKYHPHASSTRRLDSATSACLGEASPLIFNAFSKNCLKTIIMSTMTWITSANSTDVWGRSYTNFLDYSAVTIQTDSNSEQNSNKITQEEVTSFLDTLDQNLLSTDSISTPQELNPTLTSDTETTYTPYSQRLVVL